MYTVDLNLLKMEQGPLDIFLFKVAYKADNAIEDVHKAK